MLVIGKEYKLSSTVFINSTYEKQSSLITVDPYALI